MTRRSIGSEAPEVAALLNPAFMALLARRVMEGHQEESGRPLPVLLAYLATPMALHADVREALTYYVSTNLATWAAQHPRLRVNLPPHLRAMQRFVSEGILFGLSNEVFAVDQGDLTAGSGRGPAKSLKADTSEVHQCQRAARYLGRWFSGSGSPATVAALLGVRP